MQDHQQYYRQPPPAVHDPAKTTQLLAEVACHNCTQRRSIPGECYAGRSATRRCGWPLSSSRAGADVYGGYPDIEALYPLQADEFNKPIFAPIWLLAFLNGAGPRGGGSSFGRIAGFLCTAPLEDITLS